jgi:galactonate dehydratase
MRSLWRNIVLRRGFLALGGAGLSLASNRAPSVLDGCGCAFAPPAVVNHAFDNLQSGIKVTNVKVFGVSLTPQSDRPYVFVKIETNQGVVGWGEGTLEGKAGAVMACVNDFRDFLINADPMQVEHHWQSMYVHSFYRGGPVIGSAISGIDQALWDIRGKVLGMPVYKLLGGSSDSIRGYYHADKGTPEAMAKLRQWTIEEGVTCLKATLPEYYEWIETHAKIERAVKSMQALREGFGPDIDIAVDFHARTSPSVAQIIIKEIEPLNLLFVEEPCPPENVGAMAKIARHSTTPIATGERLVTAYGCRELVEMGAVDILQPDINHVGGITGLWKAASLAGISGVSMAPHACEGPIGAIATLHVDAALPNFLIQETCRPPMISTQDKIWEDWFGHPVMRTVNGRFPLPDKPGLGFELSEASLKKYPFGGTVPMERVYHEDGSVAEW